MVQFASYFFSYKWPYCVIIKIIETLILNENTANIKQLFASKKVTGNPRAQELNSPCEEFIDQRSGTEKRMGI